MLHLVAWQANKLDPPQLMIEWRPFAPCCALIFQPPLEAPLPIGGAPPLKEEHA